MWSQDSIDQLEKYAFILGSSSPRRSAILRENIGINNFDIVKSSFEEDLDKDGVEDIEYVTKTAEHKIPSIIKLLDPNRDYLLLVADTIVSSGGKVFEKPGSPQNQWTMLRHYKSHPDDIKVITAIHALKISGGKIERHEVDHEVTGLKFDDSLSDEQLKYYIATEEGLHVAGGFKYQECGSMLFKGISGDYFNVVGLPVKTTQSLISRIL